MCGGEPVRCGPCLNAPLLRFDRRRDPDGPDPDRPLKRRLTRPGLIELTSGAAKYWHCAFLWVCPHPYYTLTDQAGRFTLSGVPPGTYRLVAWLPSSEIADIDRDPNTGLVMRYHFAEPLRHEQTVTVTSGVTIKADCWLPR